MTLIVILLIVIAAYLFLICPSLRKHPCTDQIKAVLYAHRGLFDNDSDHPENTCSAFRKAVQQGYGIELDVQLSKDQIPVIMHDSLLARTVRDAHNEPVKGRTSDYTFEQLRTFHILNSREKIPSFAEVLQLVDGKVPMIVEYKVSDNDKELKICTIVSEMLENYKGTYCIESFNPRVVLWYRKNHPEIMRGQLSDVLHGQKFLTKLIYFCCTNLLFNFLTKPDFIAYNCLHPNQLSRSICHGLYHNTAAAWTVKNEQQLQQIRSHFDIFIFDSFIPSCGPDSESSQVHESSEGSFQQ